MRLKKFFSQKGSSLIEIIVATGVMALVLTTIVAGLTLSLKTNAESEYRSQAVKRAQEAMEIFRRERTLLGWEAFINTFRGNPVYCFKDLPAPFGAFTSGACGSDDTIVISGQEFIREATVTVDETDPNNPQVRVVMTMSWTTNDNVKDVEIIQVFRRWD
ncbi:MAG: type IV pilus modification PilV family protein [Patescibacteria group bacterium]